MKLEGQYHFDTNPIEVWGCLNDPEVLAKAIPGCKELTPLSNDAYRMTIELGVAAIKGTYKGTTTITDKIDKSSYTLHIAADGPTGTVAATAHIQLQAEDKGTLVLYTGEAQIGGLVAGVGQRILSGVGKIVVGQFFKAIGQSTKTAIR